MGRTLMNNFDTLSKSSTSASISDHAQNSDKTPSSDNDSDHLKDECGVFGVYGSADASAHTALGLHALQHR